MTARDNQPLIGLITFFSHRQGDCDTLIILYKQTQNRRRDVSSAGTDMHIAIWQYALNASWVLLPLVPSVVIYLIFPKTKVTLSGPLQGLSVRSTGAFAAYLIVLLATFPLLNEQNHNISGLYRPTWTITGHVVVKDENGREVSYDRVGSSPLQVSLRPDIVTLTGERSFRVTVPEIDHRLPAILLTYRGYGDQSIDPSNPGASANMSIDFATRNIEITSPILIQRSCEGMGCPP
jgi:hypothetical protein